MTRKLFGTDGIRGTANSEPMTPETALKVAMAVGECFRNGTHKHLVVIGKDTRLSGYMLEPALTAGFVTMGMDVVLIGPLADPGDRDADPQPASRYWGHAVGLAQSRMPITASNCSAATATSCPTILKSKSRRPSAEGGSTAPRRASSVAPSGSRTPAAAISSSSSRASRRGCGSTGCGSSSIARTAPPTRLRRPCLGAGRRGVPDRRRADGLNINRECGALAPEQMRREVLARRADIGIALDGDADRLIVADERGVIWTAIS